MPANPSDAAEGGQNVEWSETLHSWMFRAQIFLKRYWWIYLITISGGVAWQAYIEYNRTPNYVSRAQLIVGMQIFGEQTGPRVAENVANFYATQIALMRSPEVQQAATEQVRTNQKFLAGPLPPVQFDVNQIPSGAAGLQLSASGPNPEFTQIYLQSVIESFLTTKRRWVEEAIQQRREANLRQIYEYEEKVKLIEAQKRDFLAKNLIASVSARKALADAEDARLSGVIAGLNRQISRLDEAALKNYISGNNVVDMDLMLAQPGLVTVDESYLRNKAELRTLLSDRAVFSEAWTDQHPGMIELNGRIARLLDTVRAQRQVIASELERRRSELEGQLKVAREELAAVRAEALNFSVVESEYSEIESALDRTTKTLDQLRTTITGLDFTGLEVNDLFRVLQQPETGQPMVVDKVKQIGTGAFVGFVLGTVLIFLLGVLDGRVMSVEDVTQRFEEPMLGIIPMQRRIAGEVELLKTNDQRLMFAESCRNLRSSLLYMDRQGQRPRTVVLTSSIPAEGKSTISANLAITLGFAASRTLLVDADLRRGVLHKRFGLKNDVGLAEHLQNNLPIDQVIQRTGFENLDFIPCGRYPNQPGELLMSERFRETLRELKNKYDFIIFDSPPILATDDAASFATRTDAVLFVIRAGYTRLRQIRASVESLQRRGVPIYGIIVNFIDHREPGYYSYKYYDYYSYRTPAQAAS